MNRLDCQSQLIMDYARESLHVFLLILYQLFLYIFIFYSNKTNDNGQVYSWTETNQSCSLGSKQNNFGYSQARATAR